MGLRRLQGRAGSPQQRELRFKPGSTESKPVQQPDEKGLGGRIPRGSEEKLNRENTSSQVVFETELG